MWWEGKRKQWCSRTRLHSLVMVFMLMIMVMVRFMLMVTVII